MRSLLRSTHSRLLQWAGRRPRSAVSQAAVAQAAVALSAVALALAASSLGACASSGGTTLDPAAAAVRQQITSELEAYYADFSARSWVAMAGHFHPGATISTIHRPNGATERELMLVTADEFIAKGPEGPGSQPIFEERMHSAQMHVRGDLAVVWARYTAKFGNHESVVEWSGIDAFTLLRHDGRWRISSLTFSPE